MLRFVKDMNEQQKNENREFLLTTTKLGTIVILLYVRDRDGMKTFVTAIRNKFS